MASPLENLTGPGKPLHKEPPDAKNYPQCNDPLWIFDEDVQPFISTPGPQ